VHDGPAIAVVERFVRVVLPGLRVRELMALSMTVTTVSRLRDTERLCKISLLAVT
jgi:hypothetical protein